MRALEALSTRFSPAAPPDAPRAVLAWLFHHRAGVVVFGDDSAPAVVATLVEHFPDPGAYVCFVQRQQVASVAQHLRAVLRQDPDVVAVDALDAEAGPLLFTAAMTGHQLLLGADGSFDSVLSRLSPEPELRVHAEAAFGLRLEARAGLVVAVEVRSDAGWAPLRRADAEAELGSVPVPAAVEAAPPPRPSGEPRPAFLLHSGGPEREGDRSALGVQTAWLAPGEAWPACAACQRPLALVVRLELGALPAPLRRGEGLVQLFLCARGGCTEGVRLGVWRGPLVPVVQDGEPGFEVVSPGALSWARFDDGAGEEALACDKLGGSPAWQQGPEVPLDGSGAPMELLLQLQEGSLSEGGQPARWNFDAAELVPAVPPRFRVDPNRPCHFRSLLTAEATLFVFRGADDALAFRWQTG